MTKKKIIEPEENELPSEYADRLGLDYTSFVSDEHKKDFGQFFTPIEISKFMAQFGVSNEARIKILDPGCGIGILSTTLIEDLILENSAIENIELYAFENDLDIIPYTNKCYEHLRTWLNSQDIQFTYYICYNDFILHNSHAFSNPISNEESYDIIISNPPYFKLPKDDIRINIAKSVIHGQTNIYAIFLILAAKFLRRNGKLIFITPRSFCSGNYYRLFREIFFSLIDINRIHLFDSRKDAFKRDNVLQENIILVGSKKNTTNLNQLEFSTIESKSLVISASKNIEDIQNCSIKNYEWRDLVDINSYQKILHLPLSDIDNDIIKIFKTWTNSLHSFGYEISTGPVVDFRSTEFIKDSENSKTVPLLWFHNVEQMQCKWPKNDGYNGKFKGQYILCVKHSMSRLVPNNNYVLLRRFSTKDDNKRLIAAPYLKSNFRYIGIENHLNYIYCKNRSLNKKEVFGLATLLNSKLFDLYFRTFNGNINVSATELRNLPLPDIEKIKSLGEKIIRLQKKSNYLDIDLLVAKTFDIPLTL